MVIKSAISAGVTPLSVLFAAPQRHDVWTSWDLKLVHAYHLNESYQVDGYPYHLEAAPNITWTAKRIKLRSAEAREREESRMQKATGEHHGIRVIVEPKLLPGTPWPRRNEADQSSLEHGAAVDAKVSRAFAAQEEKAKRQLEKKMLENGG